MFYLRFSRLLLAALLAPFYGRLEMLRIKIWAHNLLALYGSKLNKYSAMRAHSLKCDYYNAGGEIHDSATEDQNERKAKKGSGTKYDRPKQ